MNVERNRRRLAWLGSVLCIASWWMVATSAAAAQSTRSVLLELHDPLPEESSFRASLRELLERIGLSLTSREDDEHVVAEVTISMDEEGATVRIYPRDERRSASKHRVEREQSDAMFRETLAHVVLGAIEPLTVEASAPSPLADPPPAPDEPAPEPEASTRPALAFDVGIAAGALRSTSDSWTLTLTAHGQLRIAARIPWLVGLMAGVALPREERRAEVESRLWLSQLRTYLGAVVFTKQRVRLALLTPVGVDLLLIRAETERPTRNVRSPLLRASPVMGVHAQLDWSLPRRLVLFVRAGCDVDLWPREFTASEGRDIDRLLTMARFRPQATLGGGWSSGW